MTTLKFSSHTLVLFSFILALTANKALTNPQQELKLVGANWCPYSCDYQPFPGFVTQFIAALLHRENIVVSVDIMSWDQANKKVHAGEYDGLITATPIESPGLLFTSVATDIQHSCFYTQKTSSWQYSEPASLAQQRLGIINNYAYGEPLDSWLEAPPQHTEVHIAKGELPMLELLTLLEQNKIDVFIQDRYVLSHFLYRDKKGSTAIKESGCLKESPFYFALNPQTANAEYIIQYLNEHLASDKNRQLKHYFKLRYGLGRFL